MANPAIESVFCERVAGCSDRAELVNLAMNAMAKGRTDLAVVALERFREVFGQMSAAPSLIPSQLRSLAVAMHLVKKVARPQSVWRKLNRSGFLVRRDARVTAVAVLPMRVAPRGVLPMNDNPAANEGRFLGAA